ncbi:DNA-binding protein [Isoptericola sp. b441]|uniref:DNA-binding protein n=1 Tax=Actinotalea lenta TaxID=3064654 RepID=A0ABT9D9S9_9CELL|nr:MULTISPECIES: PPC domain-containing DNA-binding protein [unclassified Isoptericola]MDO8107019.1 DNA-binding protein [Isoptericola sp. b441]MDO8121271.1 DNA-binding protein [Isoptericola sp. b490]
MKWNEVQTEGSGGRTFVVVADQGDEAFAMLSDFAREQGLSGAQITAVGAFTDATVGWYDRERQEYRRNEVDEQCEVLSLVGDVALSDGEPQVHVHAVLGLSDGTVRGGHLLSGHVWPTLEVIVRETPVALRKTSRPDVGLALIDLDRTTT